MHAYTRCDEYTPQCDAQLGSSKYGATNMCFIVNDNDTFSIEFFENEKEKAILEKWMNKIGKGIFIDDIPMEVNEQFRKCIENEFEKNLPISQFNKDELLHIFDVIKQMCKLKKDIDFYNTKYKKKIKKIEPNLKISNKAYDPNEIAKSGGLLREISLSNRIFGDHKEETAAAANKNQDENKIQSSSFGQIHPQNSSDNFTWLHQAFPEKNMPQTPIVLNKLIVVLHEETLYTFIVENPSTEEYNCAKNKTFGFQMIFEANLEETLSSIASKLFNEKCFNTLDELRKEIETMNVLIHKNTSDCKEIREKKHVEKFINDNYEMNSNVADKMKSSDLCGIIEENFQILGIDLGNVIAFRNRLGKYLLDIGLQKKRFGDGFYYYGLKSKYNSLKNIDLKVDNVLDKILKERETEFEKFHN